MLTYRNMPKKALFSTTEAAKILRISRIAVFKRIKSGELKAEKIGRNFVISRESLMEALGETLSDAHKKQVERTITRALKEYEETFKRLGRE